MKRRNFIKQAYNAAGVTAISGIPYGLARLMAPATERKYSEHLRPPGAIADDVAFINACIGCGLCGEVCPPRCIKFNKRDGGDAYNTPYITPAEKACTLCGKCMEACPTSALSVTLRDEVDMGIAQIDRAACYPWVDKGVCGACVAICPLGEKAISYEFANMYRPVVQEGCVGCGLCVEICPEPSLPINVVPRPAGTVARHSI